ncbi:MAG: CGNR zinc finger domain-containing protein [Acidobacteria bacterium]|nr:CGNR zinc finger domain-containing protein [Acidobacteriota bacterium]
MVGGHLILDFVNTLDWRFRPSGAEELIKDYGDLLRFTAQCGLLNRSEVSRIRANGSPGTGQQVLTASRRLRETLATILYDILDLQSPAAAAVATLHAYVASAQREQELGRQENRLVWMWSPKSAGAIELPLWKLSVGAVTLLTSNHMSTLKACSNQECRWLFLDVSKSRSRRWCDMKLCGNRLKAKRFREKKE